jgi:lipopolysaccharide/colanic/teichoic acid biosynthesis glycosyltransferase
MEQVRRAFEILAGLLALVIFSPVLLVIAVCIKLDSPGSVFFCQPRVGLNGKDFTLYKFRTMYDPRYAAPPAVSPPRTAVEAKFRNDFCCDICARPVDECICVTRVGRFLRKPGLDELPQLWNVVRGDMTFVGPRPTLRYQVEMYNQEQRKRLRVKPGITGLAQISGRNRISWDSKIELDLWYVEHRSLWVDCRILLRTLVNG